MEEVVDKAQVGAAAEVVEVVVVEAATGTCSRRF